MRAVWLAIVLATTLGGAAKAQEADYQGGTGVWEISGGTRDEGNSFRCKMERPALGGPFALLSSYNVTTLSLEVLVVVPSSLPEGSRVTVLLGFDHGEIVIPGFSGSDHVYADLSNDGLTELGRRLAMLQSSERLLITVASPGAPLAEPPTLVDLSGAAEAFDLNGACMKAMATKARAERTKRAQ
jgi:hypothetical protein